jgi:hypothetical protein
MYEPSWRRKEHPTRNFEYGEYDKARADDAEA